LSIGEGEGGGRGCGDGDKGGARGSGYEINKIYGLISKAFANLENLFN